MKDLFNCFSLRFLSGRKRFHNPFGRKKTLAGALLSTPLLSTIIGGRSGKRDLLRSALLGLSAGVGSLAMPQRRGFWSARGGRTGFGLGTIGRLLAGGLVAAAASRFLNRTWRERHTDEPHTHETQTHEPQTRGRYPQEQFGA